MLKNVLLRQPNGLLRTLAMPKRWAALLGAGLLAFGSLAAQAQTTTVFSETFEGATNSFTTVNGAEPNQWYVGTVAGNGPTTAGTKSAYISNDAGVTNAYTITVGSVTHLYRDVTFPAGQGIIQLGFDWMAGGESTYDYIQVFMVPTTVTPVAGTQLISGTAGAVQLGGNINLQPTFGRTSYQIPPSLAGTTQRLVFSWRNDTSVGTQPPAVLDNITVTAQTANPISGAYTINDALPTAGTNFHSFTDAATRLTLDGISGPTTVTVVGGPYTEQFLLGDVGGVSNTNRLIINGGGRTIRFGSTNSNQRAVVQLNGTDYTTINNLVIDATNNGTPSTYGYGILLTNAADNDRITNCTVNADIATTSSNFVGIAVSGATSSATTSGNSANNLLLEGNTVNGGYYGITLYGNSTTSFNTGNIVRNNNVRDFYIYGIYAGYQDGAQFIGNDVSRPLRTNSSTFYGIYNFSCRATAIEKNRIHNPFDGNLSGTGSLYGIYLSNGTTATATTTNDVVNNALYNLNGNGLQYIIYNLGSAYSRIYNNTISSEDQTATTTSATYGIYNSAANVDVRNNIVSISRTGAGTKYGLYYSTAAATSNYNDLYVPSGNVGYNSTAYATLAAWQAAPAGFDANSISTDPVFVNTTTGNLQPSNVLLNNAGTSLARVTEDITGAPRGTTPDIGAYEFTPVTIDVTPVTLVGPASGTTCYSPAEPVIVQIRNGGTSALNLATNPATVTVVVTLPGGTTQTFTTTISTGTLASGATQNVTLPGTLNMTALGTYSFAVTATAVGDLNTSNNTLVPAPTRTVVAPIAGTLSPSSSSLCVSGTASLTLAGSSNGNIQYQSSTSATGTFTDIAGATSAAYTTPVLNSTTYYRVRTTCNSNTVYSNVSAITVNNPVITAAPTPLTTCAGGTATLSATVPAGVNVRYYTAATGGTLVGTGSPFVTPAITANTTYYAEAFSGGQENVGKPSTTGSDGTNTGGGLLFTTTGPVTISNVTIYLPVNFAGANVSVVLQTGTSGATLTTAGPFAVPANTTGTIAPYVLPINIQVPAAGSYTLAQGTSVGLIRDYSATPQPATSFPYVSPSGTVRITDGTLAGYYYFFYNWQIGSECKSASRTPIQVNVTPGLVASLPVAAFTNCGRNPYQLTGTIAGSATGAVYTSTGTGTFTPNATTLNATYTPSAADVAAGSVTITLTPTGPAAPCTSTGQLVLTLQPSPNGAFSYPSGVYCTGAAATITPVLAPGASAGTFSITGAGLSINPTTGVINLATTNVDGTFTVINTVLGTGACATGVTNTATVTINPGVGTPALTATPQTGGSVLLTATFVPGATYQFSRNGGPASAPSTSNTLLLNQGTQSGSYTVIITSAAGCVSSASPAISAVVTGTQTASLHGVRLLVAPNPTADGRLSLELSGPLAGASTVSVLNTLGQVVHTGTAAAGVSALDLSGVAAGVYTIRVRTSQGTLTQRIVRQ